MPRNLTPRRTLGALMWALAILLAAISSGGCSEKLTSVNSPLNSNRIPYEHRARNATRATTLAGVAPPDAPGTTRVRAAGSGDTTTSASRADGPDTVADGFFVGLALSGGGSRSANFAAACMFQLERLGLLSRVDYISSVSGGSLTAAYYCLGARRVLEPRQRPAPPHSRLRHRPDLSRRSCRGTR